MYQPLYLELSHFRIYTVYIVYFVCPICCCLFRLSYLLLNLAFCHFPLASTFVVLVLFFLYFTSFHPVFFYCYCNKQISPTGDSSSCTYRIVHL